MRIIIKLKFVDQFLIKSIFKYFLILYKLGDFKKCLITIAMLYSYKMTHDTGFAPNPFHGVLSLATCKPFIRAVKKPGVYIAGFTSKQLCGDPVGKERLVYIMKVTGKLSFDAYYNEANFKCKQPSNNNRITKAGDNIYFLSKGQYDQAANYFHTGAGDMVHDLKSDQVLLSTDFFYFGIGAIPVDKFQINIPKTQTAHGVKTADTIKINNLWHYLENNYKKNCLIHPPHTWDNKEPCNIRSRSSSCAPSTISFPK